MKNLTYEEKKEILDFFKEEITRYALNYSLGLQFLTVKYTTTNQIQLEKYKAFSTLSIEQQKKICDLLFETALDTIFKLLKMFENYKDDIELIIRKNGNEYNMINLNEKMDNEISIYKDIIKRKESDLQKVTYKDTIELSYIGEREELLYILGEKVVIDVIDNSLYTPLEIIKYNTINPVYLENYKALSTLSIEQQEKGCKLLFDTVIHIIFNFFRMVSDYYCDDNIELHIIIKKDGKEYDMFDISEEMGSEVAYSGDEGWIQKFSKFKNLVL